MNEFLRNNQSKNYHPRGQNHHPVSSPPPVPTNSQPHMTVDNLHYSTHNLRDSVEQPQGKKSPSFVKNKKLLIATLVMVILSALMLLSTVWLSVVTEQNSNKVHESQYIDKSKYQAVFMSSSDNQVYFGKLEILNERYVALTDIYYVRVENGQSIEKNTSQNSNISLVKIGNELHGPEDAMFIPRDKILYWENLTETGQVVCAIRKYQNEKDLPNKQAPATECNQKNSTQSTNQTTTPTPTPSTAPATTPSATTPTTNSTTR